MGAGWQPEQPARLAELGTDSLSERLSEALEHWPHVLGCCDGQRSTIEAVGAAAVSRKPSQAFVLDRGDRSCPKLIEFGLCHAAVSVDVVLT